ncbi:hypothetical protein C8Q76DRAFT_575716, partial [Earliella scabrosa]
QIADDHLRRSIVQEWQDYLTTDNVRLLVCASCGRRTPATHIEAVDARSIDLELLRNDALPPYVLPTTYALEEYNNALLHPKGLQCLWGIGDVMLCSECRGDLLNLGRTPKYALANWLYYGYDELHSEDRDAFRKSTPCERVLVARARASKISFRFTELPSPNKPRVPIPISQRCIKGNVLVMPQDATHLNAVLPPDADTLRDTICAVFVGETTPTPETIRKMGPVLVRKSRVRRMIKFLVEHNVHYAPDSGFRGLSERNLSELFGANTVHQDEGVPCSITIAYLPKSSAPSTDGDETSVAPRIRFQSAPQPGDGLLLENVGYTSGDESPATYHQMKVRALTHCLTSGRFIHSQAGNQFVPDFENPSLLSWLFPHLDPWGIGGFFEPNRVRSLTMEEQLSYLLRIDESPFEQDPDFAFVFYNIVQKRRVANSVNFRVHASKQQQIIRDLLRVDRDVLQDLLGKCEANPLYRPESDAERHIFRVLNQVGMVGRDLPGTTAYKLSLRNEIRSLVYFKGTPALFITLNPSDVDNPIVRLHAGHDVSLEDAAVGLELTEWQRLILVADKPAACALAFHQMITAFLQHILRFGGRRRGIFG